MPKMCQKDNFLQMLEYFKICFPAKAIISREQGNIL